MFKETLKGVPDMYVTLDSIVKQSLIDMGENTEHKYIRFLSWAIRGLKKFNFDMLHAPKTLVFTLNPDKTIDLPDDYVNWSKVGVIRHGRIFTLQQNANISLAPVVDDCGVPIHELKAATCLAAAQTQKVTGPWTIFFNYRNGRNLGNLFGLGGGFTPFGYFRIDKERHKIAFTSEVPDGDIALEYITTGLKPDGSAQVHVFAEEALIQWVHWKARQQRNDVSLGEKERAKRDFYNELRLSRSRMNSFSLEDWLKATRKGYKLTPKF